MRRVSIMRAAQWTSARAHEPAERALAGSVGIGLTIKRGLLIVDQVLENFAANKAGIQVGNYLSSIEGASTIGLSLQKAVEKLQGSAGTFVTLQVENQNGDNKRTITLVRQAEMTEPAQPGIPQPQTESDPANLRLD